MGASLSDFDQWQASQTKPDTATSDFDQWQASQAPAADTADTPIYHYDPQNHGRRSQQFDPNAEPWRSVGNGDATPIAKPGLWERAKALGRGMLPQPGESVGGAVGRDVTGLVVTPFKEALDAVAAPSVGEPRRANLRAPTPSMGLQSGTYDAEHGAVTEKQRALAALGTVANVAAPALPVGEIASPLLRAGARVGVGAGVGAANSPDDPMLGAVVGGSLGAAHAGVSEAPVLHDAAARVLFPDMAEQAAQVPSLQQRTALAEADAQVANNRVTNSTEFQRRASDRSNTATQRAGAGGTTDHTAWAEANRRAGVRQVKPAAVSDFDAWLAEKPTVAPEHAGEQIVTHADGAAGDLSTRHTESHTPVDGPAPSPVPAGELASATPSVTPAAPDPALQPSLHDQAVQSAGGPAAVAAVDGNGAPEGIVYRNAGLTFPQKTGDVVRGAIDRPYPELEHQPEDLPVRDALLGAGAGRTHGTNVARYGMAHVRAGIDPTTVSTIEAHLFADNFEMQAASRAASGDDAAVTNLKAHALLARSLSSPGIEHTPDYQTYVARYRDVMEPEYTRVATASGLTADKFRAVKPGSVYIPLPADIEASAPVSVVRPATRSLGTKQSSAVRVATGGANSYVLDAQHAAEQFLPERSRVAGENELWQAVRARGRAMTGKGDNLEPGETQIAFNDKHQLTSPESEDATHYVALPERVADGVQQYVNRTREMATPPAGTVGKAYATTKKLLTKGAVAINPAVTLTHGGNIASTVNMLPGVGVADIGRTLASAVPFGNTLTGLGEMMNADLTDAANTKALLGASRYGGLRPLEADPEALGLKNAQHKALFGQNGADPRGRAIAIQRYRQANPSASDADVAQFLNKTFGAYVPANQPAGVYAGQRTGLTTFAPAGFAFTSSAVKRLGGQSGVGGIGAATRTFAKSVVAPVVGIAAANYALSGHSPLANDEGHRGDIDLGSKDDQGRERYLKSSYAFPLLNRAANTTGIRPLIEGQGATGAYAGVANEALSQVGVVPRMAESLANQQLRLSPNDATPEAVTEPQFGDGNRFMKILQRSAGGAMGAPAGIAGSTNFSADRPLMDRTLDALHLSPVGYGRAGGAPEGSALYHALDAKMKAAYLDVYHAETQADKASVIARTIQKARADGYPQDALDLIEAQLTKASEKSAEDRAASRAAAMSKKGLGAP